MNCVEFERFLLEDEHSPEQDAHLNSCPMCADLLSDLNLISSQAKLLLATDEPSPAVWNALESRLRSEGLIRNADRPQPSLVLPVSDFFRRWASTWSCFSMSISPDPFFSSSSILVMTPNASV